MNNNNKLLYLDACATTPPLNEVVKSIEQVQKSNWANPSSIHNAGIEAAELLEYSRQEIANEFKVDNSQIIFTSGATQSSYIALNILARNTTPGRIIISSVEHPSVIRASESLERLGWEIDYWKVTSDGIIDSNYLDSLLEPPTKIVSLIWGQSEIGSIQPIIKVAKECARRNIYFHTDATQVIPHGLFDFNMLKIDALSASAHKFRGPKGIGLLIISNRIKKLIFDNNLIDNKIFLNLIGTPSVSLAHSMSLAIKYINKKLDIKEDDIEFKDTEVKLLTNKLRDDILQIQGIELTGHKTNRLPNHISILVKSKNYKPISTTRLVQELSERGLYTSNGSACNSLNINGSYILKAIGTKNNLLKSGLRLSLGSWIKDLDTKLIANILSTTIDNIN